MIAAAGGSLLVGMTLLSVFAGCGANVFFFELMIREQVNAGNLITFAQFAVVALIGACSFIEFKSSKSYFGLPYPALKARRVPLWYHLVLVLLFWSVSVLNNIAFQWKISMPLHMIIRSGSLPVNMLIGMAFFNKKQSVRQVLAVFAVTIGIFLATYMSAQAKQSDSSLLTNDTEFSQWIIGVSILFFSLVLTSVLGLLQEKSKKLFGPASDEMLFYSVRKAVVLGPEGLHSPSLTSSAALSFTQHVLSLPFFAFGWKDVVENGVKFCDSEPVPLWSFFSSSAASPLDQTPILKWITSPPQLWVWMLGNAVTQYFCIRGVLVLNTMTSSLTTTLILTVRKFMSLMVSVLWFSNAFSMSNWLATLLVFGGSIVYATGSSPNPPPKASKVENQSGSDAAAEKEPIAQPEVNPKSSSSVRKRTKRTAES